MGHIGRFILGYGILPTPLTKPHYCYKKIYIVSQHNDLKCQLNDDRPPPADVQETLASYFEHYLDISADSSTPFQLS